MSFYFVATIGVFVGMVVATFGLAAMQYITQRVTSDFTLWRTWLGKNVVVKFRGGPETYMGVLQSISPVGRIEILTDNGLNLHLYMHRHDIQVFGTYDPDSMRQSALHQLLGQQLVQGGGGHVAH